MAPLLRLLAIVAIPILVACSTSTGREPVLVVPPLEVELQNQMAAHDALRWSASRPLAWTDFRGVAPSVGGEGAQTAYSLFYGLRCTRNVFQFQVTAAFLPRESWVKAIVLASGVESRRTLAHEQTHFDLTEVHARRMRKYFAAFFRPCDRPSEQLREAGGRFVREEAEAQGRYDGETRHGLVAARQLAWSTDVAQQLAALSQDANQATPVN